MLYRLLFGAAAVSLVYVLVQREADDGLVAAAHRLGDDDAAFDLIGRVLEDEHVEFATPSKCTVAHGTALVLATRRAQGRISAALRHARLARPIPQVA